MLLREYPLWQTVYYHFRKWRIYGRLRRAHDRLRAAVREREGRDRDPSAAFIDSQVVKTTLVGGPERGYDGAKRIAGRKRHILAARVHGADLPDRDGGRRLRGEGPGRTLYELTREGEAEFRDLLEVALSSFRLEELGAGVAFIQALPRRRAIELLEEQHRRATETSDGLQGMIPTFPHRDEPPHTQDLLALWSGAIAATAGWTEELIQHLESGGYVMADDEGDRRSETSP
jgi:hypothetical protein